jgi:hypothetical protein
MSTLLLRVAILRDAALRAAPQDEARLDRPMTPHPEEARSAVSKGGTQGERQ